ncbi:GatB/YqeY domain-containing protein [Sphingomicrobium aestuariivivum]|uniref:GatB/YqeY domain-containing protein n=1 Tax=Sphingomicrobium aestuariivivum TaxID=1582356 RepID=UPI001FD6F19C|nr:GatB/YqeY domain-containing protein [Sphingomicrobium aestuariivivum]MCJ8189921.1 GatB/YqeY domain-containing protein [Sphingomicrobium aestuariivivum]
MIRDDLKAAMIAGMKAGEKDKVATIRLIQSEVKNKDIEARTQGEVKDDDAHVTAVLQKMVKQRRESAEMFRKGGAEDRAATEEAEIAVIETFLPAQMSDEEIEAAVAAIIADTGATGMKDMGRVMGEVRGRHGAAIEPAKASAAAKKQLAGG